MRRLPNLVEVHAADGYASDDECRPKLLPKGYGALLGDVPAKRRVSGEAALAYQVRQGTSGPASSKTRFFDVLLSRPAGQRPSPAQTQVRLSAFERHQAFLRLLPAGAPIQLGNSASLAKSDFQILRESHRFLRSAEDDDGSWEARLARRYYDRLIREYVICDLAGYKAGHVGFRWRTEGEVIQGKGQFQCGHKTCVLKKGLRSYEVDFKYRENHEGKRALVKVRLCEMCAYKLHYKRLKAERKRHRRKRGKEKEEEESDLNDIKRLKTEDLGSCKEDFMDGDLKPDDKTEDMNDLGSEAKLSESDRKQLEALAWRGPDPDARTREDDFEDYFNDLFL